jgi:hypothetical protein
MKKLSIYILLLFTLASCKKFLEQETFNRIGIDELFKDFEGARTTLISCYDNLKSSEYYMRDFSIYADMTGGNIKYSRTNNQVLFTSYNFTNDRLVTDMEDFYTVAYNTIYRANNILQYINKATDATTFQKNRMLADAYTFRALAHFDLVRTFAQPYNFTADASHQGIVIRTANTLLTAPVPPPATVKQVYDQIIADLETAVGLYANSIPIYQSGTDKIFFSANAAKALLARVSLYKEDWTKAINLCNDVLGANQYPLVSNAQYVNSWSKQNISTESIFELGYGNRTGAALGDYYNPGTALYGQLAATTDVLNMYSAGDVRNQASMFKSAVVSGTTYFFTRKYQGTSDTANNIKIIRAAELYLIRAEAAAATNNLTNALADLNLIRKRANPAATNFASAIQQEVLDEIFNERRRELCYESHLFFDIARKKKNLVRNDCNAATCSFTYPNVKFASPLPLTP